jgi:alkanesulfonate monooxygenase
LPAIKSHLRFHWSLSEAGQTFRRAIPVELQSGEVRLERYVEFCQLAERNGIDSLLMAIGSSRPDPMLLSAALSVRSSRIKFMVACRSGLISPAYFVQQINTLALLTDGRIHINMVLGHTPHELGYYGDFLSHDEQVRRTDDFLSICQAFWSSTSPVDFEGTYYQVKSGRIRTPFESGRRTRPEIYVAGSSNSVLEVASRHADCLWRLPDSLENLRQTARSLPGRELGMLVSLIARPTHEEACSAANAVVDRFGDSAAATQRKFLDRSDSTGFRAVYDPAASSTAEALGPCLWTGAVPYLGSRAIALVGSFEEICDALFVYWEAGVSQFLFMGWPDAREVEYFGQGVLPLVRARETAMEHTA